MNALIYDLEIVNAIQDKNSPRIPGIRYCEGWYDHGNMGISVLGVYDYQTDQYRVFCDDNAQEWANLIGERRPLCVGFNNIPFDNSVLNKTSGWQSPAEAECYDLLRELWVAAGLTSTFRYPSHLGFSLDAVCKTNFSTEKSGSGALAPVLWQQGKVGAVIDYCLNDVKLTKQLFDLVVFGRPIVDPRDPSKLLKLAPRIHAP